MESYEELEAKMIKAVGTKETNRIAKMGQDLGQKNFIINTLVNTLLDNGYDIQETENYINFVMTNHTVSVNKQNLTVEDDLTGNLYKDIKEIIESIEGK